MIVGKRWQSEKDAVLKALWSYQPCDMSIIWHLVNLVLVLTVVLVCNHLKMTLSRFYIHRLNKTKPLPKMIQYVNQSFFLEDFRKSYGVYSIIKQKAIEEG